MDKPSPEEQLHVIREDTAKNSLQVPFSNFPRPDLTTDDWVEIYEALRIKRERVACYYDLTGEERKRWVIHLDQIIKKIGPDGRNMHR